MKKIGFWTGFIRPSASSVLRLSPWLIVMMLGWANAAMAQVTPRVSEDAVSEDAVSEDIRGIELPTSDSSGNVVLSIDSADLEAAFESPNLVETEEESLAVQDNLYLLRESADEASLRETFTQANLLTQATDSADEMPWRFSLEPFVYLPLGVNGDITVRGINASVNAGAGDIFGSVTNDLNFAAFGRFEAWKGPWGIFLGGAYVNLGTGQTANIPIPPALQQVGLPPQATLSAAASTSFVQLDLGGAYRFGDSNLATALRTADTEFDLGPFVFDALAGVRFYSFNNNLVLTGPLGNQFEFDQSKTSFEPMLGGRARWNLSHNLAALAGGTMSGFGLGDLTFSASGYGGVDWLFSGNTSLLASYGFTYLDYTSGNSGVNLFTHGPNIGVKFRF